MPGRVNCLRLTVTRQCCSDGLESVATKPGMPEVGLAERGFYADYYLFQTVQRDFVLPSEGSLGAKI